jgi:hypothetical protein
MREAETYTTNRLPRPLIWVGVAAAAIVLAWHFGNSQAIYAQTPAPLVPVNPPLTGQLPEELQRAEGLSRAFRSAAKRVLPAVVVIKAGLLPCVLVAAVPTTPMMMERRAIQDGRNYLTFSVRALLSRQRGSY